MEETPDLSNFFGLIRDRQLREAEETLSELFNKIPESRETEGFFKALEGLILPMKHGNDRYLYAPQILSSKEAAEKAEKEFEVQFQNPLHDPYDRGYYKALKMFAEFARNNSAST